MTAGHLLSRQAQRVPNRQALICGDRSLTFADLDARARGAAGFFHSIGLGQGDRLAIYAGNSLEWAEIFFASSILGVVLVPISARMRRDELTRMLANGRPSALVFDPELLDEVVAALEPQPARPRLVQLPAQAGRDGNHRIPGATSYDAGSAVTPPGITIDPLDWHSICYTSGTTGAPKGAVLTHANVVVGTHAASIASLGYTEHDVFLNPTPLAHRAGWARLVQSVGIGATQVLLPRFDPEGALGAIQRHRVTLAGLVPTMIRLIDRADLASRFDLARLTTLVTTAEACPTALRDRIRTLFPSARLLSLFASTEAGQIAVLADADQGGHPTATGRPLSDVELRIVSDDGRPVPTGEVGEISVRTGQPGSASVMLGYWNGESLDTSCFDDGWYRTGDCGRLDAGGLLHLADRKKDMILSGGFNISSQEIESVLRSHPGVGDVAVVGEPDDTWGESVVAVVVRAPGAEPTADELIDHCRRALASYKKPRRIRFIDALPRNAAGKVLKYRLRERMEHA